MRVTVKAAGECLKDVTVEVAPEAVAAARETVLRQFQRASQVPGFRVGHAPRDLIEQHYGPRLREETIRQVIREQLPPALQQAKLDVLGDPEVNHVTWEAGRPLTFTARCELMPAITVRGVRGLKLKRSKVAVTDAQVEEVLQQMKAQPQQPQQPLDEAALRPRIRQELEQELARRAHRAMEEQAIQRLLDQTPVEVPPSLVQSQAARRLRQAQLMLLYQGVPPDQVEQRWQLLAEQSKRDALQQVKTFFLLRQVARDQRLMAAETEIAQQIEAFAARAPLDQNGLTGQARVEQVRADLERRQLLGEVAWEITRRKVLDYLLAQAEVQDES